MQTKTIQKNIENKMIEWLGTITDEKLRKEVKRNILVSGGCIASMFLGEDLNDYDVYLQNQDVLANLARYYTKDIANIRVFNGKEKDTLLKEIRIDENIFSIAISNLKMDQIKLFFNNLLGGMRVNENIEIKEKEYVPLYFSPNCISLSNKIQIVLRFSGDATTIHKNYDFVHATNYYTFKDGLVTNKDALESLLTKQLKYQGSLYPLTSILRMKKFVKRNWNINAGEVLKIMFQISELDLHDPNVLEDQLIGIDVAYFPKVIEILRNVKIEKITSTYLNEIIDRVFGQADDEAGRE